MYLFLGLTGMLILVMVVIAIVLNCKIRKLDEELDQNELKKKE